MTRLVRAPRSRRDGGSAGAICGRVPRVPGFAGLDLARESSAPQAACGSVLRCRTTRNPPSTTRTSPAPAPAPTPASPHSNPELVTSTTSGVAAETDAAVGRARTARSSGRTWLKPAGETTAAAGAEPGRTAQSSGRAIPELASAVD